MIDLHVWTKVIIACSQLSKKSIIQSSIIEFIVDLLIFTIIETIITVTVTKKIDDDDDEEVDRLNGKFACR